VPSGRKSKARPADERQPYEMQETGDAPVPVQIPFLGKTAKDQSVSGF